jgi:hypothetical protein
MFDSNMISLGTLCLDQIQRAEATGRRRKSDVRLSDRPGYVRRLLAALRGIRNQPTSETVEPNPQQSDRAGVLVK